MTGRTELAPRPFVFTLVGIGAATAAAHVGNNFSTYLVGGLIDRYQFTPSTMGAWSMAETLSYAAAMFVVAPRARAVDARLLALLATALIAIAQAGSALTGTFALLFLGRIGAGLGFGLMNSAVNLAAGRTASGPVDIAGHRVPDRALRRGKPGSADGRRKSGGRWHVRGSGRAGAGARPYGSVAAGRSG